MFVKWSSRKKRRSPALGDLLVARLVESHRPGPGLPPRQRNVAYLGAIRTEMPVNHRVVFWENAAYRLDQLDLAPEVRASVEAAIESRVPRATREDWVG